MQNQKKDAIYDAVKNITGLEGIWENQKNGIKPSGPHFTLKLLFNGQPFERKGDKFINQQNREVNLTKKFTTLSVKIFGDENASDKMSSANNNTLWHKTLNKDGLVSHYLIRCVDISSVYDVDWEDVQLFDFYLTFTDETLVQPEVETDDFVDKVRIYPTIDDEESEIRVPLFADDEILPFE